MTIKENGSLSSGAKEEWFRASVYHWFLKQQSVANN